MRFVLSISFVVLTTICVAQTDKAPSIEEVPTTPHAQSPVFVEAYRRAVSAETRYVSTPFDAVTDYMDEVGADWTSMSGSETISWVQARATEGSPKAQWILGEIYRIGDSDFGIVRDLGQAARWLQAAGAQDVAEAQASLGELYLMNEIVPMDLPVAIDWLTRAGNAGVARAQRNMGLICEHGIGVVPDQAAAVSWYKLASHGDTYAQAAYGLALADGRGVKQDYFTAWLELLRPAINGFVPAQLRLAYILEHGLEVTQDNTEAYSWYDLASRLGTPQEAAQGTEGRERVRAKMSPEEIAAAQVKVEKFLNPPKLTEEDLDKKEK